MPYAINHVHIRAKDPEKSAAWYEEHFRARIVSSREVMPGTISITLRVDGPAFLSISSQPPGSSQERRPAELNRLGLEHFGFSTDHIEDDIARLEKAGVKIVLPVKEVPGDLKIAYFEGPDDVLIELMQSTA